MFERALKVFIDTAVASAPVSNLNTTSWPFTRIGVVHEVHLLRRENHCPLVVLQKG